MTGSHERPPLVSDPDKVTPAWLTDVLRYGGEVTSGRIVSVDARDVGTGQVGNNVRFALTWDPPGAGPASVVGKFASRDQTSRQAGVQTRTYETEVAFYTDIAGTVDIRHPKCWYAEVVAGTPETALIMEDLSPAEQGDQIAGCSVEQAKLAMVEAARLHGPRWGDPTLSDLPWLAGKAPVGSAGGMIAALWQGFAARYEATLTDEAKGVGERLVARQGAAGPPSAAPPTVVHGDYRIDNMLFGSSEGGVALAVVDWQTTALGAGASDVSYFIGAGLSVEDRRANERDLVAIYHEHLASYGVKDYSLDQCFADYRRNAFGGFFMAVLASMIVGRTERGDAMFMAMANRHAAQIVDLDSETLLG